MLNSGHKVEFCSMGDGLVVFKIDPEVSCVGCRLRPIPANGGFEAGCLAVNIALRTTRVLDLPNGRVAEAVDEEIDPTNCGVLDMLRAGEYIEDNRVKNEVAAIQAEANVGLRQMVASQVERVLGRVLRRGE